MKRLFIILIILLIPSIAFSAARKGVTKDENGIISHVSGYVTESGVTVYETDGTAGVSGYFTEVNTPTFNSDDGGVTISNIPGNLTIGGNATITGSITAGSISTAQRLSLTSGTTLSGTTLYSMRVGNYGASSTVTHYLVSPTVTNGFGPEITFAMDSNQDVWVCVYPGDIITNQPNFVSGNTDAGTGVSVYILSGTTGSDLVTFFAVKTGIWSTHEAGTPTLYTWD